jgi:hypothetical protein
MADSIVKYVLELNHRKSIEMAVNHLGQRLVFEDWRAEDARCQ